MCSEGAFRIAVRVFGELNSYTFMEGELLKIMHSLRGTESSVGKKIFVGSLGSTYNDMVEDFVKLFIESHYFRFTPYKIMEYKPVDALIVFVPKDCVDSVNSLVVECKNLGVVDKPVVYIVKYDRVWVSLSTSVKVIK